MQDIVLITPELAAGAGGVADYTRRVVEQWPRTWPLRFLLPEPAIVPEDFEDRVETMKRNAEALREKLPARSGKVLLQYSAYGFDHFGYPRWLLHALTDWKNRPGNLLVVMFHEIWTFWPVLNKNYVVQQLHRRDLRKLVSIADAVFTSTPSQTEHLRELASESVPQVLPVGSNIRLVAASDESRRQPNLAVLFGLQDGRLRALRELHGDLVANTAAGTISTIVTVGGGNSPAGNEEERVLLSELRPNEGFEQLGVLPEAEVSALFSRASFGITAQDELSLMKSGTFMAYAAHGLNILSKHADPVASEPICWLTNPADLARGISTDELHRQSHQLREWQERTSSWPAIAARFADALKMEGRPEMPAR